MGVSWGLPGGLLAALWRRGLFLIDFWAHFRVQKSLNLGLKFALKWSIDSERFFGPSGGLWGSFGARFWVPSDTQKLHTFGVLFHHGFFFFRSDYAIFEVCNLCACFLSFAIMQCNFSVWHPAAGCNCHSTAIQLHFRVYLIFISGRSYHPARSAPAVALARAHHGAQARVQMLSPGRIRSYAEPGGAGVRCAQRGCGGTGSPCSLYARLPQHSRRPLGCRRSSASRTPLASSA